MALRTSENDDSELNPGQSDYDRKFNNASAINKTETAGTVDNSTKNDKTSTNSVRDAEESPDSGWKNNFSGVSSGSSKSGGKLSFLKKKGPLATIIITVVGGGIGIGGLLSPSLLLVQLKETMVQKFNGQLTSMDIRTNKILKSKAIGGVGICSSVVSIRCKYSSMSDAQVKRFKKAGIDIDTDASKSLFGRNKVNNFVFEGKTISPSDFTNELGGSVGFRSAVKKGYSPLLAGFADDVWNKAISKLGISKKGIKLDGVTDSEKLAGIQADTKNPVTIDEIAPKGSDVDANGKPLYPDGEASDAFKKASSDFDTLKKSANDLAGNGIDSAAGEIVDDATESTVKAVSKTTMGALSAVKITGGVDNLCTIYGTTRAVGYAAKTVRSLQLARYAMLFLTVADQIKAGGNPDPADVSYLGSVLTAETKSADGKTSKTATDSYGYKYAAYGETGKMPSSATQFLAGAGFTGVLTGITSKISNMLGKTPNTTCRINNGVFMQIGSAAVGIGAAVATGGISLSMSTAFNALGAVAIGAAVAYLPALLKDIIAGVVVDSSTTGELAGDAITSGSSGMMGTVASMGGNAPLTIPQAIAYQNLSNNVIAQYAEEDRLAYSPLDVSNKNTFMGSLVSKLLPQLVKMSSLSGSLSSISSTISMSISSIIPLTKAADGSEYTICEDPDYVGMGLAADPYCNLVYGVPPDDLNNISPTEVLDKIGNQIDPVEGTPIAGSEYETFVNDCTNRSDPIGYTGDNFDQDSGEKCLINNSNPMNKYYYLYQIDQRVEKGMDGEELVSNTASDEAGASAGTTDMSAFDSKTMKQLAESIIKSGNVNDNSGQIKETANGKRTNINIEVLKLIAGLAVDNKFTVSSIKRDGGGKSMHDSGKAVDISGANGINGSPFSYSGHNSALQSLINKASPILSSDCEIGVPNTTYISGTKSGCQMFVDLGSGPHLHLAVGGG